MSVIIKTEKIAEALQSRMNSLTFRWKSGDDTQTYTEQKPKVYAFTYDDLSNYYPIHTPAVCVQLLSVSDDGTAEYLIHVCVCNPALQDKEITKPITNDPGFYEYKTGKKIDSAGVRTELYKYCLMLGEQVYIAMKRIANTDQSIHKIELQTPAPYLSDFPFAECTVSFVANVSQTIEYTTATALENML